MDEMESFDLNSLEFNKKNTGDTKKELDILHLENYSLQQIQPNASFDIPVINNSPPPNKTTLNNKLPLDLSNLRTLEELNREIPFLINGKIQAGKPTKVWQCRTCLKEFSHQYTLMRHLPTHTDERKFQCNTCGKAFRQMSTLSQHRAIHSQERPYVCEVCQKTFNRVSTLISHRKTHTGVKPHQCHLCNKAFHQKGNLRNHIFTHTNERPYKCDDCGKGFNQMSNLMCHRLKSHQQSKFYCLFCGKGFTKKLALGNHEQNEHISRLPPTEAVLGDDQKISNAIFVEPIKTKAMKIAIESSQVPFALLRPLTGIPVLVRVLPAGDDKQMLVPASAEDLKKHGKISVTPKTSSGQDKENENSNKNLIGSTVQIKIPVVATVIQQSNSGGHMCLSVVSPGPEDHCTDHSVTTSSGNCVFRSTTLGDGEDVKDKANADEIAQLATTETSKFLNDCIENSASETDIDINLIADEDIFVL